MAKEKPKTSEKIELKRELGLFSAVSIILAVMIGRTQLFNLIIQFCAGAVNALFI